MARKRYIVELGTGADLHGKDATKAACRAVKDAISRSCLCGILEILDRRQFEGVYVDVLIACPDHDTVDTETVAAVLPVGIKTVHTQAGGMTAPGICVPDFGEKCDTVLVANAAVTVFVDIDD